MLITFNGTRENGNFCGDQLCSLKTAYLFLENEPKVDKVFLSCSPSNEMHFLWKKFIDKFNVQVVWDDLHPGDWPSRWNIWDQWYNSREINGVHFDHYRELYLRIHGAQRQNVLCGYERGLGRRNIYEYWLAGQENQPDNYKGTDWFDDTLCYHPELTKELDVYISPHCKTQGNLVFTFDYWLQVATRLLDVGLSVTVGYNDSGGTFHDHHLRGNYNYRRYWGNHEEWFKEVARHKVVACGNTGTGWVSAACGVPLITMEPHNSVMADHRYRECGLRNIVEVIDGCKLDEMNNDMNRVAQYCATRIIEECRRKVVLTTGCYDILHAGHVRHLQRAKALGTKLIVALNSDSSVSSLKGTTRPINKQEQRKFVLESLRCVDEVRIFDGLNALEMIGSLKPDVVACGYGYNLDTIVGKEIVEGYGGKVVVTCPEDASQEEVSTTKIIKRVLNSNDINEICRIGVAYSVNPASKLKLMAQEFVKVYHLEGDVADLGCYRGGTSLILKRLAPDKHLHLFDTWEGNPYDDELCHHKKGEWSCSLEDCQLIVGKGENTHFHKGVFPYYDFPESLFNKFCFVYIDMDTYQSTKDAIQFFWPRLVSGGKMIFDDYGWIPCAGVKRAVDEVFTVSRDYTVTVVPSQWAFIVEKK